MMRGWNTQIGDETLADFLKRLEGEKVKARNKVREKERKLRDRGKRTD